MLICELYFTVQSVYHMYVLQHCVAHPHTFPCFCGPVFFFFNVANEADVFSLSLSLSLSFLCTHNSYLGVLRSSGLLAGSYITFIGVEALDHTPCSIYQSSINVGVLCQHYLHMHNSVSHVLSIDKIILYSVHMIVTPTDTNS